VSLKGFSLCIRFWVVRDDGWCSKVCKKIYCLRCCTVIPAMRSVVYGQKCDSARVGLSPNIMRSS
jgi:hypothetical protein